MKTYIHHFTSVSNDVTSLSMSSSLLPTQISRFHATFIIYFCVPFILIDCVIFCRLLYRIHYVPQNRTTPTFQYRAHIICFCCIILSTLCDVGHAFGSWTTNTSILPEIPWISTVEVFADIFYFLSSITIYIILIHRLHRTFKYTTYRLGRCIFIIFFIMITIQCLLMTAYCILLALENTARITETRFQLTWHRVLSAVSAAICISDVLFNLCLLALFIRKLKQSMMARIEFQPFGLSQKRDKNDLKRFRLSVESSLSETSNMKTLHVITKLTIIGTAVTFCSIGFMTSAVILDAAYRPGQQAFVTTYWSDYCVRAVEGALILSLLYLGLGLNETIYMRVCGCCHRKCFQCAQRRFKNEATHDYVRMEDMSSLPE